MLNMRLAIVPVVVLAVAVPSLVYGAGPAKPAAGIKPAVKSAPAAPAAKPSTLKATQEGNLKKFRTAPDSAVVAVIGDQKVTKAELMNTLYDWMSPLALDEYINYVVVQQAVKKEGVKVTDADIDAKISELTKTQIPPGQTLADVLQKMKMPMARFRAYVYNQVALEKITDKRIQPTAQDYAQYVKASHILVKTMGMSAPNSKPEEKAKVEADAKAKIEQIAAEIKAGKSFAEAAKEYSDDTGSKDKGGSLGWFKRGEMVPEFTEAAFSQKTGEISQPVKTLYGYHLILVESQGKDAAAADKAALRAKIIDQQKVTVMRQIGEQLRLQASVVNYISPQLAEAPKPNMSRNAQPVPQDVSQPRPGARPMPRASSKVDAPPPAPAGAQR